MHPGTTAILRHFEYDHLPEPLKHVSAEVHGLAHWAANSINDDPELTTGLRKLLEAKDCLARAAHVAGMREAQSSPHHGIHEHSQATNYSRSHEAAGNATVSYPDTSGT